MASVVAPGLLLLVVCGCGGTSRHERTYKFFAANKTIVVHEKTPPSITSVTQPQCEIKGSSDPSIVMPVVNVLSLRVARDRKGLTVNMFDATSPDEREAAIEAGRDITIDPRTEQGLVIVQRGPYVEYYCVSVRRGTVVDVTIDLYTGLSL